MVISSRSSTPPPSSSIMSKIDRSSSSVLGVSVISASFQLSPADTQAELRAAPSSDLAVVGPSTGPFNETFQRDTPCFRWMRASFRARLASSRLALYAVSAFLNPTLALMLPLSASMAFATLIY